MGPPLESVVVTTPDTDEDVGVPVVWADDVAVKEDAEAADDADDADDIDAITEFAYVV